MLRPLRFHEPEVVLGHPTFCKKRVAKGADIGDDAGAFGRTRIEPDLERKLGWQLLHFAKNYAVVPPYRGRQHRQSTEGGRVFDREMHREQSAERRSTQAGAGGAWQRLVLAIDEGLDLLDKHPAIKVGAATALVGHPRGRVLVDAVLASVIDRDDDQRLDLSLFDQRLRGLVDVPFLSEGRGGVDDILTVLQIERRVTACRPRFVARRQVDEDRSRTRQKARAEASVGPELASERVRLCFGW